jgi:hypothetical protein
VLQATALLVHNLAWPHQHDLVQSDFGHATHEHGSGSRHDAPAQDPPPCPVWVALQGLGAIVAGLGAAIALAWLLAGTLVPAPTAACLRRFVGAARARAPPG